MNRADKAGFIYRAFYYLRVGYSLYLSFPLTLINTLVLIYYFAVKGSDLPGWLGQHKFLIFSGLVVLVVLPLAIFLGWVHFKRLPVFAAEADLYVEANPYYYKLPPGLNREVVAPAWLAFARANKRLLEEEGLLTEEDEKIINDILEKAEKLRLGESVS